VFTIRFQHKNYINEVLSCTWHGCEVPGMILLCDLKGATQRDCSKDMSVHVSVCINYDFSPLLPDVWKLWCW